MSYKKDLYESCPNDCHQSLERNLLTWGFKPGALWFNSLPNGKILDWSKLKAFAGNKINGSKMMISLSDRVENIVGKGENAGYQHFLLFPQCFFKKSPHFHGLWKLGLCGKESESSMLRSRNWTAGTWLCHWICLWAQKILTHYHTMPHFDGPKIFSCGKHRYKQFLRF